MGLFKNPVLLDRIPQETLRVSMLRVLPFLQETLRVSMLRALLFLQETLRVSMFRVLPFLALVVQN
jgi:hypothetical protein